MNITPAAAIDSRPRRLVRSVSRRTMVLATVAMVAFGGATAASAVHADSASAMKKEQCWYKGWFLQDGQWWYGYFKEDC